MPYFFAKWGIRRRAGIIKNAGNVILLKDPKTTRIASSPDANGDVRCCGWVSSERPCRENRSPTLSSTMRCIKTKLHATRIVSIEFEKVCV